MQQQVIKPGIHFVSVCKYCLSKKQILVLKCSLFDKCKVPVTFIKANIHFTKKCWCLIQ